MPGQGLRQVMRGLFPGRGLIRVLIVLPQHRTIIRMSAVFNDELCTLVGGLPAQVSDALLGDDNRHIMLGLIHMGNHGNNAGNLSVLGNRLGGKDTNPGIPGEVAAAAQTVHHLGAHDMGRIDVAVNVQLDGQ